MNWITPQKPAEMAENRLIDAILQDHFPIGSSLPAERELAAQLGVTRPTLREALQRLARDGWIEIHHGKPTRVCNYWQEGNLGVLGAIAHRSQSLPPNFVPDLLSVRLLLAPTYARLAIERSPGLVIAALQNHNELPEAPEVFAIFDWNLHHQMTVASSNPIYTLILNGFRELYQPMAQRYFQSPAARASSRAFYARLQQAACAANAEMAEAITRQVMTDSLVLWRTAA
ncbi:MAG: fatty acid metabolism transcriptional regulator FadR [Anaerolineales bacterium]|nr:fatty acid metabolism transcriptional regulator FadR [Anaerolineales bacterium]